MSEGTPLAPLTAPRSLAEDAADRIREQILSGGFSQGEHLVEAKIAEQLAISRGPVREAFKLLRSEGLLNEEPRRGTFVVSLSTDDVRDIYGLRAALEGRAARTLARDRDPAAIEQLRSLADQIDAAVASGDAAAVSRADLAFHQGLCALCGNARIVEVFDRYVPTMRALAAAGRGRPAARSRRSPTSTVPSSTRSSPVTRTPRPACSPSTPRRPAS